MSHNHTTSLLTYPNIDFDSKNQSTTNQEQRFPSTGTIDQVGSDIQRIKKMGVDHIVFGYNFIPIGRNLDKMLDVIGECQSNTIYCHFMMLS